MKLYFVKGHCGWDVLTLLLGEQIPADRQLSTALKVLDHPVNGGIEVGLMERTGTPGDIRLRVTDSSTRDWLALCGGMTQVIGKALVETALREHFGIDVSAPVVNVRLITESCVIPVKVELDAGTVQRVTTTMDSYAALLYSLGTESVILNGVPAVDAGEYLIVRVTDLESAHPGIDFTSRLPGPNLDIVAALLAASRRRRPAAPGLWAILYDSRPEGGGQFRVFPRFIDDTAARLPYEFQCGTGTIAFAAALAHVGELPFAGDSGAFVIEWGSQRVTPDPYGIRTSRVEVRLQGKRVVSATFSHSVIEIVAEGMLSVR